MFLQDQFRVRQFCGHFPGCSGRRGGQEYTLIDSFQGCQLLERRRPARKLAARLSSHEHLPPRMPVLGVGVGEGVMHLHQAEWVLIRCLSGVPCTW